MKYFTVNEAASEFGFHRDTLLDALHTGQLRGFQRKHRGHWRIKDEDMARYIEGD